MEEIRFQRVPLESNGGVIFVPSTSNERSGIIRNNGRQYSNTLQQVTFNTSPPLPSTGITQSSSMTVKKHSSPFKWFNSRSKANKICIGVCSFVVALSILLCVVSLVLMKSVDSENCQDNDEETEINHNDQQQGTKPQHHVKIG